MVWTLVDDAAARFENFMAVNLLAWTPFLTDADSPPSMYLQIKTAVRQVEAFVAEWEVGNLLIGGIQGT